MGEIRMNKKEFIDELRSRLRRLPADEIASAVNYYEEYFSDAGSQNEGQTIEALGSPSAVASKIIGEYAISDVKRARNERKHPLLIAILAVCSSPITLPIAVCIMVVVLCVALVFFCLAVSGAAVAIAGSVLTIASFWAFSSGFSTGIFYLGAGLLMLALGTAITIISVKLARMVFRSVQHLVGKLLIRRASK